MHNGLRKGLIGLTLLYSTGCSSNNTEPRTSEDANSEMQETVHVTHEEETTVTTRREVVEEHSNETRDGNNTTTDSRTTRTSTERRLRTVDRQEGTARSNSRNITLDLEGLVSGISNGRIRRGVENENVYFEIEFTYEGTKLSASLVDFTDEFIGGEGNHVFDYFVFGVERGNSIGYFMRVNFSDNESMDYRQNPHSASLNEYVPVGNVVYRVQFEGTSGAYNLLSEQDIMRLVDVARERLRPEGYQ